MVRNVLSCGNGCRKEPDKKVKKVNRKQLACAVMTVGLAFGPGVASATTTWTMNGSTTMPAMNAWFASGGTDLLKAGEVTGWDGGVGVKSDGTNESTSPNHALDNRDRYESLLLNFGPSEVRLDTVSIGWSTDRKERSDFFLLAYTGSAPFSGSLSNSSYGSLLSSGWTLIGNYAGTAVPGLNPINYGTAASVHSSFWLIGAGSIGSNGMPGVGPNNYYDYIKIASVSGVIQTSTPPAAVPEPGSLVLAGLGLLGLVSTRRRRKPD